MPNLNSTFRYTLRQLRMAPVFTAAATLTLALGIGGTTAIFTMIHEVMLRSLPVADPSLLYRIGDGDNCCVQSGPQDRWGMFSYPLYERLKAQAPEFDEAAAFQAGGQRFGVRREGSALAAKPLRAEYVTGNYFSTLGVRAFGGRLLSADDDRAAAAPVLVLSHRTWQTEYGADASVVGASFMVEGHPFTVIGVAPPGFFGETLRGNPPDIWIPVGQEPLIAGESSLLRQPASAWLRVIGRLHPGASTVGMAPRLTAVLRQWLEH
ncbi:MAG: ABC transporter permease, partial [Acidobacteria bacterium]|nr:ABC transporter permease [Acidobacteriota bacterium]